MSCLVRAVSGESASGASGNRFNVRFSKIKVSKWMTAFGRGRVKSSWRIAGKAWGVWGGMSARGAIFAG